MTVPVYFRNQAHALNIIVVGAGGTGSLLLSHLARINMTLISQGTKGLVVTCIDPDIVKEHNPGRQLFTKGDIGRSKAAVCIERINRFYGTYWSALQMKFDQSLIRLDELPGNIVISCADNADTRIEIHNYLVNSSYKRFNERYDNHFWIDTGNSRYSGQVILGSYKHKIPTVIDMYPDIKDFEEADEAPSCSLAEAVALQDLFINPVVAMIAGDLVWNITQQQTLEWTQAYINLKSMIPIRYKHYEST